MNNRFLLFLLATLLTVSCNRCKDECDDPTDPQCPNYEAPADPCAGSQEVSADFVIENRVGPSPADAYYIETDGVCCNPYGNSNSGLVRVRARQDSLNYTWIIGSDTIHGQEYSFVFGHDFCGGSYPITLIVQGEPDSLCFPYDNGMDTLTRIIHVVDEFDNPLYGIYKVAWCDQPNDSFEVKLNITQGLSLIDFDVWGHNFTNFNNGDSCAFSFYIQALGYKYIKVISSSDPCRLIRGEFWVNLDDSFEADYSFDTNPDIGIDDISMIHKRLKGRRIQ
jgi:hypothetical protein